MTVFAEYSLWFIPLCIAIGIMASYLFYTFDTSTKEAPKNIQKLMLGLRAGVISLLLLLLVGLFTNIQQRRIEKPIILFLQDNSESILIHKDSAFYKQEYPTIAQDILEEISKSYDVQSYSFGSSVERGTPFSYTEKETNISAAIHDISARYYTRNIGAIILASDGIHTSGENPLYSIRSLPFATPIYSIALGDSVQQKDAVIQSIQTNTIAFINNPFPFEIDLQFYSAAQEQTTIRVFDEEKQVFSQNIRIRTDDFYQKVTGSIMPSKLGNQVYTVVIDSLPDEITYANNKQEFILDVLESRQKVAILYHHIHPDVSAIKQALETNHNITVEQFHVSKFEEGIESFNCIIFHGLPQESGTARSIVEQAFEKKIPAFYIYNSPLSADILQTIGSGVTYRQSQQKMTDEVQAQAHTDFSLFSIRSELQQFLQNAPPVYAPYGSYQTNPQAQIALWQRVQSFTLPRPLLVFHEVDGVKNAVFTGEGMWRWRIHALREFRSSEIFDSFINSIITYLSLRESRSVFSVSTQGVFSEITPISFTAELYDQTFTPIVSEPIFLELQDSIGTRYSYTFIPHEHSYSLHIGRFPPGKYSYTARCTYNNQELIRSGVILVTPMQLEHIITQANVEQMRKLAELTKGQLFFPNTMHEIPEHIKNNTEITSVSHTIAKQSNILNYTFLLILLVLLAGTEWFLRKYFGG